MTKLRVTGLGELRVCGDLVCWGQQQSKQVGREGVVRLESGAGTRRGLRGRHVIRVEDGELRVEALLEREEAVASVVENETRGMVQGEAKKAVGVLARSLYAVGGRHADGSFCDSTHCQTLRRHAPEMALGDSRGMVVARKGKVFAGLYTARCGGHTMDGKQAGVAVAVYAYPGVVCRVCERERDDWVFVLPGSWKERVMGMLRESPERLRIWFGREYGWQWIRSNRFRVREEGGRVWLEGSGLGHSVGLCLRGAEGEARGGESWRKILSRYLPETSVLAITNYGK